MVQFQPVGGRSGRVPTAHLHAGHELACLTSVNAALSISCWTTLGVVAAGRAGQTRVAEMSRFREQSWLQMLAAAIMFCCPSSSANSQQRFPGIFGFFGGVMNSVIVDETRREWQRDQSRTTSVLASP